MRRLCGLMLFFPKAKGTKILIKVLIYKWVAIITKFKGIYTNVGTVYSIIKR